MNACAFLCAAFGIEKDDIVLTMTPLLLFVTEKIIAENIKLLASYDGVTTTRPAIDTILVSADGKKVDDIPIRKTMFSVQTPQTFRVGELIETIASLTEAEKSVLTDAAKAYLLKNKSVGIVLKETANPKLTTAADLHLARVIDDWRKIKYGGNVMAVIVSESNAGHTETMGGCWEKS